MKRRVIRILLVAQAVGSVYVGAWALFAPRSFFDGFPGGGSAWTAGLPPYNEHLVRDVGAFNLVLAGLAIWAAVVMVKQIVIGASLASLVFAVPHTIFHAFNLEGFSTADAVGQMVALALTVAGPIIVVVLAAREPARD